MGESGDEWPHDRGIVVDGEPDLSALIEAPSVSEAGTLRPIPQGLARCGPTVVGEPDVGKPHVRYDEETGVRKGPLTLPTGPALGAGRHQIISVRLVTNPQSGVDANRIRKSPPQVTV